MESRFKKDKKVEGELFGKRKGISKSTDGNERVVGYEYDQSIL
jgi:hypothetical protein